MGLARVARCVFSRSRCCGLAGRGLYAAPDAARNLFVGAKGFIDGTHHAGPAAGIVVPTNYGDLLRHRPGDIDFDALVGVEGVDKDHGRPFPSVLAVKGGVVSIEDLDVTVLHAGAQSPMGEDSVVGGRDGEGVPTVIIDRDEAAIGLLGGGQELRGKAKKGADFDDGAWKLRGLLEQPPEDGLFLIRHATPEGFGSAFVELTVVPPEAVDEVSVLEHLRELMERA